MGSMGSMEPIISQGCVLKPIVFWVNSLKFVTLMINLHEFPHIKVVWNPLIKDTNVAPDIHI